MKRPAIGPFIATGVALVGAAAIVANPLVPPPADIQVSAAEFAAGKQPDVLDPDFLASIGAAQEGWQNPVKVLESLLSGLVDTEPDADLAPLASTLARFIETGEVPAGVLNPVTDNPVGTQQSAVVADVPENSIVSAAPSGSGPLDGVFPDGGARDVVLALADIGSGFGTSGATFLRQVGLAPAVVAELAQQVRAGSLSPIEALRRIVLQPWTGHPALTGNPEIDELFTTGLLQPLIEALIANLPGPIGQSGGLIDTFEQGLTQVAGSFGSTEDSADLSATTETETVVGDGDATSETAESSSDADQVDESTTGDNALQPVNAGGNGAQSQPRSGRPGGFADQISDAINDFTGAITNSISGGNGQRAGQGGSSGVGPSSGGAGGGGLRSSGTDSSKGGAGTKGSGPSGGAGSAPGGNNG